MMRSNSFVLFAFLWILFGSISCTTTQKVNTGSMAMEFKQYHRAIQLLKEELNRTSSSDVASQKAFQIAYCYEVLNDVPGALTWYQRAFEAGFGDRALFKYAQMLKRDEQYKNAVNILSRLVQNEPSNIQFRKELTATRQAAQWATSERGVVVTALPINSQHADFNPVLGPNQKLYFASDRRESTGDELYNWTGQKFMDIYETSLENMTGTVQLSSLPINSEFHESTPTFHPEGRDIVFSRCGDDNQQYDQYCLLYHAVFSEGRWNLAQILPFQHSGVNYKDPHFSKDGTTLYFSADDEDGFGRFDLWEVNFDNGIWGEPTNLGPRINTEGNEVFPSIYSDTLYFSSDFGTGLGGLDIYFSTLHASLGWLPPQHLEFPINSGGDDMSYIPIQTADYDGIFASSRKGGEGADDLYFFKSYQLEKEIQEKEDSGLELEVSVVGEIYNEFDNPSSGVADLFPLQNAVVDVVVNGKLSTYNTNSEGKIIIKIDADEDYLLVASAPDHLNRSEKFSSFGISPIDGKVLTYSLEIQLPQKFLNKEIVLNNIYYDYDKAEIRPDAAKVLDTLARLLIDNPALNVQMGSHTDCRGDDQYNVDLSLRRAQAAVDYLASRGVKLKRLSAKGYGETERVSDCFCENCTEEEFQKDRRTTFMILE